MLSDKGDYRFIPISTAEMSLLKYQLVEWSRIKWNGGKLSSTILPLLEYAYRFSLCLTV